MFVLYISFPVVVLHDYNVKLPSYTFNGGKSYYVFPFAFFIRCGLLGGRQHFLFSHRRYKIFMFNLVSPEIRKFGFMAHLSRDMSNLNL